jgi:hypothetical protein
MRAFDWLVVVAYIGWIVIDGLRRSRNTDKVDGYFLASRSLPWWAVGLSVMATPDERRSRSAAPRDRDTSPACASCRCISACRSRW